MIIREFETINGTNFIKTYSSKGMKIERDGILYDMAYDPHFINRTYKESEVPVSDEEDNEAIEPGPKQERIMELKKIRDEKELEPVLYNGSYFDFDEKSYNRIVAAIFTLDLAGGSIMWTLADNTSKSVTAADLRAVIAAAGVRSNMLHVKYRQLKEAVLAANEDELSSIVWNAAE